MRSFTELAVYEKVRGVEVRLFELSKRFPREETYSLTDQLRRSSRSIGAQIAEAWAKRRYSRHFVSKLTDADAEQLETQHWVRVAKECGYLTHDEAQELLEQLARVGRMLNAMMRKAQLFCGDVGPIIRDPQAIYQTITDHRPPTTDHR